MISFCHLQFRRRKGEKLFLVAFYECDEDYELENLEHDRLYCSKEKWVGNTPKCMQINDDGEDEDGDENSEGRKLEIYMKNILINRNAFDISFLFMMWVNCKRMSFVKR
jgi:hypothetical protein